MASTMLRVHTSLIEAVCQGKVKNVSSVSPACREIECLTSNATVFKLYMCRPSIDKGPNVLLF